ncbi:MAG: hypothetical protein V3S71_04775 [Acidobacteriota bacterium]
MACEYRRFLSTGLVAGVVAVTLALVAAWGAPASGKGLQAQNRPPSPATVGSAATTGKRVLVKPSDEPNLLFLFTDQVVGYIQPCG